MMSGAGGVSRASIGLSVSDSHENIGRGSMVSTLSWVRHTTKKLCRGRCLSIEPCMIIFNLCTFFLEEKNIGEECRQTGEGFVVSLFFYYFSFLHKKFNCCIYSPTTVGAAAAADGAYSPFVDSQRFIARVFDRGEIIMSFHWLVCCSGHAVKKPELTRSYFS